MQTEKVEDIRSELFKSAKLIENSSSHVDFLLTCQHFRIIPKGMGLGKRRFHRDMDKTVLKAGLVLLNGELDRLLQLRADSIRRFERARSRLIESGLEKREQEER